MTDSHGQTAKRANKTECRYCSRKLVTEGARATHERYCEKSPSGGAGFSPELIQERRERVMLMRIWARPYREISDFLGISVATAHADAQAMLGEISDELDQSFLQERIAMECQRIQIIENHAQRLFLESLGKESAQTQAALLARYLDTWQAKVKFLQDLKLLGASCGDRKSDAPDYSKLHRGALENERDRLLTEFALLHTENGVLTLKDGQQVRFEHIAKSTPPAQSPPP